MRRIPADRYRYRATAAWEALAEAANGLPTGHPTRRAIVDCLSTIDASEVPPSARDDVARLAVQAILLGPPLASTRPS